MRIGIDLDGVLADFIGAFNTLIKAETGLEMPAQPTEWNYHRTAGVTKESEKVIWEYIRTSLWWGTLHALPGAVEAIGKLNLMSKAGDDIYFITSRPGKLAKFLSEMWLRYHGMDNPTVLVTDSKGPVALGLKLHVFVDDKPENIADVIVATDRRAKETKCYLIDQPWNQGSSHPRMFRVSSLNEVLERETMQKEMAA